MRTILIFTLIFSILSCKTSKKDAVQTQDNVVKKEVVEMRNNTISQEVLNSTPAAQKLIRQNEKFKKEIVKLTDNVYAAVGYDVSNVTMVIGKDSIFIIDSGMIPRMVKEMKVDLRKISDKPLAAVILTHGHGDHTGGVPTFVGDNKVDIWGKDNFGSETNSAAIAGFKNTHRPIRQAGFMLDPTQRISNGVAKAVYPTPNGKPLAPGKKRKKLTNFDSQYDPNKLFSGDSHKMEINGVKVELYAAPGETDDQIFVYLPDEKVLCTGDNMYRSWPNIFAIRGTIYRDANQWHQTLSKMLEMDFEHIVPGHTVPWVGKENSRPALTNYRDAVKFVFDKTIEGMNKGLGPDELVAYVKLPKHLADLDYLTEFYGRIDWSVRSIHNGYLGWFDGNATSLNPLTPKEEAIRMSKLVGGENALYNAAAAAMNSEDFQWAAQLADHLIHLNFQPVKSKRLKAEALTMMAKDSHNALTRNYFLTTALQLKYQAKTE